MQLNANDVHIWSIDLSIISKQENQTLALLSADETARAHRFHFPIHRERFVLARSALRQILSLYLNIAPNKIEFFYTEYKKPYLNTSETIPLQFNLAHSHEMAVYAFTLNHAVGIDIEKMKEDYDAAVAKRYFSHQENEHLNQLPNRDKIIGFYRLWARKEAVIKAAGKGLFIPLSSFSVSVEDKRETIVLENEKWTLLSLDIHPAYQTALASNQNIKSIWYWRFFNQTPTLEKISKMSS